MYKPIDCTHYKQEINAKPLLECWRECMAKSSFATRKTAVEKFNAENSWKKRGLAMIPLKFPVGLFTVAMGQVSSWNPGWDVTRQRPGETEELRKYPSHWISRVMARSSC